MKKQKTIKQRLLALGVAGIMMTSTACSPNDKNQEPDRSTISEEYFNVEDCYQYVEKNDTAVKYYNSENVYLLYDKETYDVKEYLFTTKPKLYGLTAETGLYDLESEELLVYCDGIVRPKNEKYYNYIAGKTYQVHLSDLNSFVPNEPVQESYSLEEIKQLEPKIESGLKTIIQQKENKNNEAEKTLVKRK